MTTAHHSGWFEQLRRWAKSIKRDVHALYFAARDRRTPWYAKALAFVVAAYALSPIDLIPDFIPVIGYLDDIILVPLGILLVVRMIPPEIMAEYRHTAAAMDGRPTSLGAAIAIVIVWICAAAFTLWLFLSWRRSS
ncbi:YkvA family protein [Phyllobacterium sp. LjRoot231]|uniref:YkvA family protein n=1 Tax=Phyllobacterium sp. LjRoot231 TaxID=3342289 RepID=UPI003ECF56D1